MKKNIWGSINWYWPALILAGLVFYLLNLNTPFQHDDYAYCFYYDTDSAIVRPTNIWVTGLGQMIQSIWHHYLSVNGRFSSHLLLQFFCAFAGKGCFNICNAIVFALFLNSIVSLSGWKKSVFSLAIVFLLSLLLLPFPGQTMLWMTGSLNYLWPAAFSLLYIQWILNGNDKHLSAFGHIVAFIACLMTGWANESITVPVAAGLFLYFIFNREKFKGGNISSFAGYATGAALIVFSPGTFTRFMTEQDSVPSADIVQTLFHHLYATGWGYVRFVFPVLALIALLTVILKSDNKGAVIKHSLLGFLFLSFTAFLFALGYDEARVFFGVCTLCLVMLLRLSRPLAGNWRPNWIVSTVLVLLCAIPSVLALQATRAYSEYDKSIYDEVRRSPAECVLQARPFEKNSRYVYATALTADRNAFHNRVKAFYYGKDFIQALPSDLYSAVREGTLDAQNEQSNYNIDGQPLYRYGKYLYLPVKRLPSRRVSIDCLYEPDNGGLSSRQRITRYLFNTLDKGWMTLECFGVESNGNSYLVLPAIDVPIERIKAIRIADNYD